MCVRCHFLCLVVKKKKEKKSRSCLAHRLGDACHLVHKLSLTMICMIIVWSALGKSTLLLLLRTLSVSTASRFLSECSTASSLRSWGSRVELAERRGACEPPLSRALSPDREVPAPTAGERPGASSE